MLRFDKWFPLKKMWKLDIRGINKRIQLPNNSEMVTKTKDLPYINKTDEIIGIYHTLDNEILNMELSNLPSITKDDEIIEIIYEDYDNVPKLPSVWKEKILRLEVIISSILIISVILLVIHGIRLIDWSKDNNEFDSILSEIKNVALGDDMYIEDNTDLSHLYLKESDYTLSTTDDKQDNERRKVYFDVNFDGLKELNSDTVAWLRVPGAKIDIAVVKGMDNYFYLYRDFYKKDNGAGWVFADSRSIIGIDARNIIIHGHDRQNGSAFGSIKQFLRPESLSTSAWLNTPSDFFSYEVMSIYYANAFDECYTINFDSNDAYEEYLQHCLERSLIAFGVEVTADSKIMTLSTCKTNSNNERLVVQFKLTDWYKKETKD